jgi:hypothetical protein
LSPLSALGRCARLRGLHREGIGPILAARDIDQVGDHGRRGRPFARAAPWRQQATDKIALRQHGVQRAIDIAPEDAEADEHRMHALEQTVGARFSAMPTSRMR